MKKKTLCLLLVALSASSFASDTGWSRVGGGSNKTSNTSAQNSSNSSNALVNELLSQVQQLQQEVSELRGLNEQQANEIRLLKKSQKASYQDMDKRLQDLSQRIQAKPQAPVASSTNAPSSKPEPKPKAVPSSNTKKASYKQAMELVRAKNYDAAINEFSAFYEANPKSTLAANALYWMGEVQMVKGDVGGAKVNFTKVVKQFGDHPKSADAHYKLAMIKHKQGDAEAAKAEFKKLIKNYTGKSERIVRLAKAYLKRLEKS